MHFATDYDIVSSTTKLTGEEDMMRKRRNRQRPVVKQRFEVTLDHLDIDLSFEDVLADLNFGVGPLEDSDPVLRRERSQVGKVA